MLENDPDFCVLRQDSQKSVSSTEKKKVFKDYFKHFKITNIKISVNT